MLKGPPRKRVEKMTKTSWPHALGGMESHMSVCPLRNIYSQFVGVWGHFKKQLSKNSPMQREGGKCNHHPFFF